LNFLFYLYDIVFTRLHAVFGLYQFGVKEMKNHEVKAVERRFLIAILLTGLILAVGVAGSWWTGSLALLSYAAHVFLDIFALGLSWLGHPPIDLALR